MVSDYFELSPSISPPLESEGLSLRAHWLQINSDMGIGTFVVAAAVFWANKNGSLYPNYIGPPQIKKNTEEQQPKSYL